MKIKEAILLVDDMSGDPEQPSRVKFRESFTVRDLKELVPIVEEALYMRLGRVASEKEIRYDNHSGRFDIYCYYSSNDGNAECEAYFSCKIC